MLINQNHEISIKLAKRNEVISHLKNIINNGFEEKKETQRSSLRFPPEDESSDSVFK
jgi:hypothetical protein